MQDAKKSPKSCHLRIVVQICRAISSQLLRHISLRSWLPRCYTASVLMTILDSYTAGSIGCTLLLAFRFMHLTIATVWRLLYCVPKKVTRPTLSRYNSEMNRFWYYFWNKCHRESRQSPAVVTSLCDCMPTDGGQRHIAVDWHFIVACKHANETSINVCHTIHTTVRA